MQKLVYIKVKRPKLQLSVIKLADKLQNSKNPAVNCLDRPESRSLDWQSRCFTQF